MPQVFVVAAVLCRQIKAFQAFSMYNIYIEWVIEFRLWKKFYIYSNRLFSMHFKYLGCENSDVH